MAIAKLGRAAIALLVLTTSSLALAAAPKKQNPGGVGGALQPPRAPQAVLYDQTSNPATNGAPDQDFEASFDAYDSEGADDFVVPAGGWVIQSIDTVGTTGTAGGSTVDVTFYTNSGSLPGTSIAACTYAALTPVDTDGSFNITLPTACTLTAGTYWVALQTNQNYAANGQHFWSNRTVASGANAAWRNPGDGFATGCTTWTAMTTCGVGGGTNPDFLFRLNGILPVDLTMTKTAGSPSVAIGAQETYTLNVQNVAGGAATNVVVTDTLPAGLTYVSNSCGAAFASGTLTWTIGNLAAAGSATCQLVTTVTTRGGISNTATVTATELDPNSVNNSSTATVTAVGEALVPTLNGIGLAGLGLALAAAGLLALRRTV